MKNLDYEYVGINPIYEQQKEYRQTPEGKLALRRAKERQLLKKMKALKKSHGGGDFPHCVECNEKQFEKLMINKDIILCYMCRYERPKVLTEEEICQ